MISFDSRFWRFQLMVAWTHRCGPVMREIFMVEHGACGGEAEMFTSWHLRSRDKRKVRGQGITLQSIPVRDLLPSALLLPDNTTISVHTGVNPLGKSLRSTCRRLPKAHRLPVKPSRLVSGGDSSYRNSTALSKTSWFMPIIKNNSQEIFYAI